MAEGRQLAAVVTWTVLLSTFLHGITAYPLARLYGAYIGGKRLEARAEHQTVSEHPVRHRHVPEAAG